MDSENSTITRQDHLEWCKRRALEYVDAGDLQNAFGSMMSDLGKHDETREHPAKALGLSMHVGGKLNTAAEMRDFIDGFN